MGIAILINRSKKRKLSIFFDSALVLLYTVFNNKHKGEQTMTDKQIETTVKTVSNNEFSIGMFMILVSAHKNYPFENEQQVLLAWENYNHDSNDH